MEATNFTTPLQAVQMISMFTYLTTISDFLYFENYLKEKELNQPIPIVNALYNYFLDEYHLNRNELITIIFSNGTKSHKMAPAEFEKYKYDTFDFQDATIVFDTPDSSTSHIRNNIIVTRKRHLAKKLIEGTDLYGGKTNEILDNAFVDALYKHIITTLVFEKYTNIHGFLTEIVRNMGNLKIGELYQGIRLKLSGESFLNEDGSESKLESLAIGKIMEDFIYPLLPNSNRELNLLSVDYIYAQAGSIFYDSAKRQSLIVERNFTNENLTEDRFNEYIATAHAIEQSVIAKNINETALGIFALPALLYYAYKEGKNEAKNSGAEDYKVEFETKNQTEGEFETKNRTKEESETKNRTEDKGGFETKNTGTEAFRMLFQYLNDSYQRIEEAKENDYRYQFYSVLSNFKNRTTLAREMIKKMCPFVGEDKLGDEAERYKNNHDTYKCKTGTKWETLVDINHVFEEQVEDVGARFFNYEKESIRDAFGSEAIKSIDASKLVITRGFISESYFAHGGALATTINFLRESDDLLHFYYPDNDKSVYYAVIRDNNYISVVYQDFSVPSSLGCLSAGGAETNDTKASSTSASSAKSASPNNAKTSSAESTTTPTENSIIYCTPANFRRKLGLDEDQMFRPRYFGVRMKTEKENFDHFVTRIAEERASKFKKDLKAEGYDQTRKEWWKAFGLSLIPFYNCIDGIRHHNAEDASLSCTMDVMFLIPFIGEVGSVLSKLTTSVTRSLILSSGTTLGSLFLRATLRETLTEIGGVFLKESTQISSLITREAFSLTKTFLRCLDPGFELIYTIGKGGLRSIASLIKTLEKYPISLKSLTELLRESEAVVKTFKKLPEPLYPNQNVYINSLSLEKDAGYGYKIIQSDKHIQSEYIQFGKRIEIRKVLEFDHEIPVVYNLVPNNEGSKLTCRAINTETGIIKKKVLHLRDEHPLNLETSPYFELKSFHDTQLCGKRTKRSPIKFFQCLRSVLRDARTFHEREAVDYTRQNTKLPIDTVKSQLRKFSFPEDGEMQLQFVRDWHKLIKEGKTDLPAWSKQYELKNPSLFEKLRYANTVDKVDITIDDTIQRLDAIYEKNALSPSKSANFLSKLYNTARAYELVTIEDYYAIREYMGSGYRIIGTNTIDARKMREAFYHLAIRQSDDPLKEYEKILYRGENRPPEIVERLFFSDKKELELNRFTSTSNNQYIAYHFQFMNGREGIKVFYEMKFDGPFLRAKIRKAVPTSNEGETVLLPGSKFRIDEVKRTMINGEEAVEVKLTFMHDAMPKHKWYQKIMDELEKLKTGDVKYESDPSPNPPSRYEDLDRL